MSNIDHLPLGLLGLGDLPAVPLVFDQWLDTLARLGGREFQTFPAKNGLSNVYTINGITAPAHTFMYGHEPKNVAADARQSLADSIDPEAPRTVVGFVEELVKANAANDTPLADSVLGFSLDQPEQFALSWTTYLNIERDARPLLPTWAATLRDADVASAQFWPLIAQYGLPFYLLVLQKVGSAQVPDFKTELGLAWTPACDAALVAGTLFAIDLRLFTTLKPQQVHGTTRFTPATLTLLRQDPATKALEPIAISVSGFSGAGRQSFDRTGATPSAWLYALQAAKTSVTVYGIWLGHVYHWHMVTAAMQMTMYNTVPSTHALYQLLEPQSDYLMAFDNILLVLWPHIAPPTSVISGYQFLELMNTFARGRGYFDDDPLATLARNGIVAADFSVDSPWDRYPLVAPLLKIWDAAAAYINVFVSATYPDNAAVKNDATLQTWLAAAASSGNIRGLPAVDSQAALVRVLTSLLYRVTMHGCARLVPIANPGLSFVANFPPCLQDSTIPAPADEVSTAQLLKFLPQTGTIGSMLTFLDIFSFSVPYESFVPIDGAATRLFFPGGPTEVRNAALIQFRGVIVDLITELSTPNQPQIHQWPLNIET